MATPALNYISCIIIVVSALITTRRILSIDSISIIINIHIVASHIIISVVVITTIILSYTAAIIGVTTTNPTCPPQLI